MNAILEYINNDIKPFDCNQTMNEAQDLFIDFSYSHFPVLENKIYIGCLSREDAETLGHDVKIDSNKINFDRFFAKNTMSWLDVQELFARNQTNLMPVLDEKNQYLGYFEMEDIIKIFNETPFLKEEGGIIVVKKNNNDFSMSQVIQIVESNNAKLLGLFISKIENNEIEITLKISLGELNGIVQTFRRFEYEIISQHQEDSYIENLKERSEYLDKYLNI
ncbi:CBS domain-containing protein [Flavobacterium sp.]|jgi:Mg/Co/Ni transporter MgtE|uniref:CBS domain-containing protein n=1 Tax=Flavobacterium sp. TaxID=239 RepID=UPI002A811157|nr:CBS domain-containing protein [Flavobacterium sp.]